MKHKTLRCTAETAALLLTVAMLAFLIAGLHQHDPDRVLSTLNTGWYQLTDGVRREITLPVTLPAEPGQTLTLYNDTLTARDAGKLLSARRRGIRHRDPCGRNAALSLRGQRFSEKHADEGPPVGGCGDSGKYRRTDAQPDLYAAFRPDRQV